MSANLSSRNTYLDITKGILILLVILGHSIQYGAGSGNQEFWENPLFRFIYSFHMPLFMLISGYLFTFSYQKRGGMQVLKNRLKTLLYPIFSIEVILVLCHPLHIVPSVMWMLWFFWAIIFATVAAIVMYYFRDRLNVPIPLYIVLMFFGMMLLPDYPMISVNKFVLTYFLLGGVFRDYSLDQYVRFAWLAVIPFMGLLYFFHRESYIYISGYTIIGNEPLWHLIVNVYRFILGLLGSISFLWLLGLLHKALRFYTALQDGLIWMGKYTLQIYFLQTIVFYIVDYLKLKPGSVWQQFLVFVTVTITSFLFIIVIRRFKYISLICFGKVYK